MTCAAIFILLPLLASVLTQQPARVAKADPATTTYADSALHFSYTYPSTLVAPPDTANATTSAETNQNTGVSKTAEDCGSVPVAVRDATVGLRLLFIFRVDFGCAGKVPKVDQLGDYANSKLDAVLAGWGRPSERLIGKPYMLGEHSAAAATRSAFVDKSRVTFFAVSACILADQTVVCWAFVSVNDCAALAPMMAYPIQFEGKEPTAVIPEKTISPCKA